MPGMVWAAFLDQDVASWRHVIDTNITGTVYLLQKVLKQMVARDDGKVLVTGSIAGYIPGSFQAVYNGTKAFVDNFTDALRNEIKDSEGRHADHDMMPGPGKRRPRQTKEFSFDKCRLRHRASGMLLPPAPWRSARKNAGAGATMRHALCARRIRVRSSPSSDWPGLFSYRVDGG
jgi:NADP-dependent 3-hydroxy acid dehydrogenase YdfG